MRSAFPESSIPYDRDRSFRDFSYNFIDYPHWDSGKSFLPEENKRFDQTPIWPADLFGVTAALLERSGAYQRLAEVIRPSSTIESLEPEWQNDLLATIDPGTDDRFGVHPPHRALLRLIGALWSHGALFVSGLHNGETILSKDKLAVLNAKRAIDAVEFLKRRLNREIKESHVNSAQEKIFEYVMNRVELGTDETSAEQIKSKHPSLIRCAASTLALDAIIDNHNRIKNGTAKPPTKRQIINHYSLEGEHEIGPYCLIIWANEYLQSLWDCLRKSERPISLPVSNIFGDEADWEWWRSATRLLIIADEAGKGMGFSVKPTVLGRSTISDRLSYSSGDCPQAGADCRTMWEHYQRGHDDHLTSSAEKRSVVLRFSRTLTRCFEEELGSVLPKARTPGNGCTIRSLSHNLALLPPKGRVRARWARQSHPVDRAAYNILVVPYPYQIRSKHVEPCSTSDNHDDWGFFTVNHGWLYEHPTESWESDWKTNKAYRALCHDAFWKFLENLISDQPDNTVHAVVLPESALDWDTFNFVQKKLPIRFPWIEMLVCGLASVVRPGETVQESGNFVATYMRTENSRDKDGLNCWAVHHTRSKHHRWKLDAGQLQTYALSNRLAPDKVWWENIALPPREMLFAEFSSGSVLTSLICEDLARIEPCQVALRSVGPNLVLVLLMDTAQIVKRWPHQYAGVLADDPGCSVLTLTSFGLLKRSNLSEGRSSREIALWREPHSGGAKEISLPVGYDAQLISIRREFCFEKSLDGRGDNSDSAIVWKFAGLIPIKTGIRPPGGKSED